MKTLRRVLLVLVLLFLVGVALAAFFLDPLVAKAIEKGSTYATGVETKVGSVDAGFFAGRFGIEGLSLANPPGFEPEPFLEVRSARATWQNGTILSDRIEMEEFVLDGVNVSLEKKKDGSTNYGKILENLEKLSGEPKPEEPAPQEGGKAVTIEKIEIKNVHAKVRLEGVPLVPGKMEVTIPSIVLEDVKSDGDTKKLVAQITREVIQAILHQILISGKNLLPDELLQDLGHGLGDLTKTIGAGAKEALKGIEGALKGAGGIFDKKK